MKFEDSHPWISFELDLLRLDPETWLLLGEAVSKCRHIAGVPLRPEVAQTLNSVYLARGLRGTVQIEGNTLTEGQVLARVEGNLTLPPSLEYQGQEVDNVLAVFNGQILPELASGNLGQLTYERLLDFNRQVLADLPPEEDVTPGAVRTTSVGVSGYLGAPAEDCEYLLRRLCEWLPKLNVDDHALMAVPVAVIRAIVAHLYLAWIHPFGNGNGRTARLIEAQLLMSAGVPTPAAHLLSDHYNRTRSEYYRVLSLTSHSPYPVEAFIRYALQGFVDELTAQIERIREEQVRVTWENYVHDLFRESTSQARLRQRHPVLDLSASEPTPKSQIPEVSHRVARDYGAKGPKTLTRDLNALVAMDLIRAVPGGYVANVAKVIAWMPLRVEDRR